MAETTNHEHNVHETTEQGDNTDIGRESIGTNAAYQVNQKSLVDDILNAARNAQNQLQSHLNELNAQTTSHRESVLADERLLKQRVSANNEFADHLGRMAALGHRDLATDRIWNVDEVAEALVGNQSFVDGLALAVVAAMTTTITDVTSK